MLVDIGADGALLNNRPVVVADGIIHKPDCARIASGGGETMTWLQAVCTGAAVCPDCGGV